MSELLGTLGQVYENRKTNKLGTLTGRNEYSRTLTFTEVKTGEPFTVTEASFRNNWRKHKEDEESSVETAESEEVEKTNYVSDKDAIQDFIDVVGQKRDIRFTTSPFYSESTELVIDNITAISMNKDDGGVRVTMLPDLYTYSDIKEHVIAKSLHFNAKKHLAVSFIADYETFGEVLQSIKDAAIEINLYGYYAD